MSLPPLAILDVDLLEFGLMDRKFLEALIHRFDASQSGNGLFGE